MNMINIDDEITKVESIFSHGQRLRNNGINIDYSLMHKKIDNIFNNLKKQTGNKQISASKRLTTLMNKFNQSLVAK